MRPGGRFIIQPKGGRLQYRKRISPYAALMVMINENGGWLLQYRKRISPYAA